MATSNQTPSIALKSLMKEYQLSNMSLSRLINLSPSMVNQLVSGQSKLTVPVVLRLAKVFGKTPDFWLDIQRKALLDEAKGDKSLQKLLNGISRVKKPAAMPKTNSSTSKNKAISSKRKVAGKVPGAKSPSRNAKAKKRK